MNKLIKYPVTKAFRDKLTKEHYAVGSFYQCDDPDRIVMLQQRGFLSSEIDPSVFENEDDHLSLLNGTVDEVKQATTELDIDGFRELLEAEKTGKKRKSVIEFFELKIAETESGE
ncbi:hypothetical protein [Halalkalibacter krulwichiae]|uniref:Uncharacterized protein n=1 Tax=Halalkalibacter krulwichiae TaxID=199441 RepID=A0A1X9MF99_9BACI|nr:hypothetical protein [Halalkalibacter krulwichiae]ARK32135.1 hypothetical protein BkAM31D_21075 [Halalkalibacter krulwichiae]